MDPGSFKTRALAGMICAVLAVSALAGAVGGLVVPEISAWTFVGAELVVGVAAVLGVAYWVRGTGAGAPGLTLGLVAGTVLVASAIGFIGAGSSSGLPTKPLLAVRVALCGVLVLAALVATFRGSRRSWRDFVVGVALGLPGVVTLGMLALPSGRAALGWVGELGVVGGFVVASLGFLVITALMAASVQLVVRAVSRAPGRPGAVGATTPA